MDIDGIAENRVREADGFFARGATYGGFVRLGEVLKFVNERATSGARDSWRDRILEKARPVNLETIQVEATDAASRISQMLSTAGTYDAYEIVLLLTLRIELESAEALLAALDRPRDFVPQTVDDDVRALRADKHNTKAYEAALGMLRRNWDSP